MDSSQFSEMCFSEILSESVNECDSEDEMTKQHGMCFIPSSDMTNISEEQWLEAISLYVPPSCICSLFIQSGNVYVYFKDPKYVVMVLNRGIDINGKIVPAVPLVSFFTVFNVPPTVKNSDLRFAFCAYGCVLDVKKIGCSMSSRFSHVFGTQRRVTIELPEGQHQIVIPNEITEVLNGKTYVFLVQAHCIKCGSDGHTPLQCTGKVSQEHKLLTPIIEKKSKVYNGCKLNGINKNKGCLENAIAHEFSIKNTARKSICSTRKQKFTQSLKPKETDKLFTESALYNDSGLPTSATKPAANCTEEFAD